jgi:hypothetical protein
LSSPSPHHPRPWHRGSIFGEGPRIPRDREQRAVWKARLGLFRRAGRLTALHVEVGLALLRRLGTDGRCEPAHDTLARDAGCGVRTVQRALAALRDCGLAYWVNRLVRAAWRAEQTSNAYILTLGPAPDFPANRCGGQIGSAIRTGVSSPLLSPRAQDAAARESAVRQLLALGMEAPAGW